ncbi:MAG: 50S ribosomal protein L17 [Clostridiales bacterium]|jgi:large subunit ribosomal protein L17|nr:50S ribosomal protein L17 [Clostridiales bacterium]
MAGYRKLGRKSSHRELMLRNMTTQLLQHGRITTTETRAKEIRKTVEKMITLGKKGDLHAQRQALSYLTSETVVKNLFDEIAPKYQDRNGGYTRIIKTAPRRGDSAPMAIIELL